MAQQKQASSPQVKEVKEKRRRVKKELTEEFCLEILKKNRIYPTDGVIDFRPKSKGEKRKELRRKPGLKLLRKLSYLETVHEYLIMY